MKKNGFRLVLAFGLALGAWYCSSDSSSNSDVPELPTVSEQPFYIGGFLIDPATGAVSDVNGTVVGQLQADGTVTDLDGNVAFEADTTQLPVYTPGGFLVSKDGFVTDVNGTPIGTLQGDGSTIVLPDGTVVDLSGNVITIPGGDVLLSSSSVIDNPLNPNPNNPLDTGTNIIVSSSSVIGENPILSSFEIIESSSSVGTLQNGSITYTNNLEQTVARNNAISTIIFSGMQAEPSRQSWNIHWLENPKYDAAGKTFTITGTVPDYFNTGKVSETWIIDGTSFTVTINVTEGSENGNNNQNNSSSSVVTPLPPASSSSSIGSSSSYQQQGGGSLLPNIISGAQTKSGYATRYWDACKPHCAWEGKGGPIARTCRTDGVTTAGVDETSVCDGGNAGTCFDQTPQIVNDTIAYAFAATPGGGNDCGKCYMLTFKGTGASATSTPTDAHHRAIKGKHLIVMSSNIGYDVSHNQFDLMIPGGGPGAFNGCGKMGISCAGAQYGGFLTTCNYDKNCLIKMCNSEYANNTSLKNGCLFLANWMDAANNPEVDFVEVECPAALKAKY